MEFEVNRLETLEAAKKAARVAPASSPVDVLNGILVECDTDSGEIFMTATNLEVSIQQKLKASVCESGEMLITPRLLVGMLSLLPGEFITLSEDSPDILRMTGGKCVYEVNCLPAERYPKPVMPFPEETVKLSGIRSLARKTVFATSKDPHKPVLQCVNLQLRHNVVHAAACDGTKLILVKKEARSPVNQEFLVPAEALRILASISADEDVFEVGDVGGQIVFTKDNMMFTTRKVEGDFIDTASIVKSINPVYTAVIDAGFYYNSRHLQKLFQILDGRVRLELDSKGTMLVKSRNEVYVQAPQRVPANNKNKAIKEAA